MFETLFTDPRTIGRHQSGPMSGERLRYLEHLKAQGTRRGNVTNHGPCAVSSDAAYGAARKRSDPAHGYSEGVGAVGFPQRASGTLAWSRRSRSTKILLSHHIAMAAFFGDGWRSQHRSHLLIEQRSKRHDLYARGARASRLKHSKPGDGTWDGSSRNAKG